MNTATATIDEDTKKQHAAIDRRAQAAKDFQIKLGQLERQVEEATQRLVNAAAFKTHLSKRIVELRELLITLWGRPRGEIGVVSKHSRFRMFPAIAYAWPGAGRLAGLVD
jgi:septal ring factor EnvC (AmiA/AmiB activator)